MQKSEREVQKAETERGRCKRERERERGDTREGKRCNRDRAFGRALGDSLSETVKEKEFSNSLIFQYYLKGLYITLKKLQANFHHFKNSLDLISKQVILICHILNPLEKLNFSLKAPYPITLL